MRKYLLPFAISVAALAWSFPAFAQNNRNGVVVVQADPQQGDAMRQGGMGGMSDRREMMSRRMMEPMGRGMMGSPSAGPEHAMMMRIIFALMDSDGDGTISLQEFQAAHERLFKAMDSNKDGQVTLEEMQAFIHGQPAKSAPQR